MLNEENPKTVFQQAWIVLTHKAQYHRKINRELFNYKQPVERLQKKSISKDLSVLFDQASKVKG